MAPTYYRRQPERTVLHQVVREHLDSFVRGARAEGRGIPGFARAELERYLGCGILAQGLVPDGVWVEPHGGASQRGRGVEFVAVPPPTDVEVRRVCATTAQRVVRLLKRRGMLDGEEDEAPDLLGSLQAKAILAALLLHRPGEGEFPQKDRCAAVEGFSVHANVALHANDRQGLERLCRYGARPSLSLERMRRLPDGRVGYRLKRTIGETREILLQPEEMLARRILEHLGLPAEPPPRGPQPTGRVIVDVLEAEAADASRPPAWMRGAAPEVQWGAGPGQVEVAVDVERLPDWMRPAREREPQTDWGQANRGEVADGPVDVTRLPTWMRQPLPRGCEPEEPGVDQLGWEEAGDGPSTSPSQPELRFTLNQHRAQVEMSTLGQVEKSAVRSPRRGVRRLVLGGTLMGSTPG